MDFGAFYQKLWQSLAKSNMHCTLWSSNVTLSCWHERNENAHKHSPTTNKQKHQKRIFKHLLCIRVQSGKLQNALGQVTGGPPVYWHSDLTPTLSSAPVPASEGHLAFPSAVAWSGQAFHDQLSISKGEGIAFLAVPSRTDWNTGRRRTREMLGEPAPSPWQPLARCLPPLVGTPSALFRWSGI